MSPPFPGLRPYPVIGGWGTAGVDIHIEGDYPGICTPVADRAQLRPDAD